MANEEHLAILRQGVDVWNEWRKENPRIRPYLEGADLSGADLSHIMLHWASLDRANLQSANLYKASLGYAELFKADLRNAFIHRTFLRGAHLMSADLSETELYHADLIGAFLFDANLSGASFKNADLTKANLSDALFSGLRLSRVLMGETVFANVDLSQVMGLDDVIHMAPSFIDIRTIYKSGGNIPESFLRGAGVPDTFITFMKSLTTSQAIDFYSCFISHSSKDKEFAERLYADLQSNGVRCWYAPHDMQIGAPILTEIDSAIRLHDKLLLILSENSVGSRWVEHEVLSATTKEYQQERDIRTLFPIRLDDAVMDTDVSWAQTLKGTRHIGDFTQWKDHDAYKKAFDILLANLKGDSSQG